MFDILSLKQTAFKYGLKHIFQSDQILKVFHDVRFASDQLKHPHDLELVNVFDTMLADVVLTGWIRHRPPAVQKQYLS
jgi:hypothetical protein